MPGMDANADARFPGYRFPAVIIGEVVRLRYRFNLSLRDIPALVARSGIVVSHETVRQWCETFGPDYAKQVRRRRPRLGALEASPRHHRQCAPCTAFTP